MQITPSSAISQLPAVTTLLLAVTPSHQLYTLRLQLQLFYIASDKFMSDIFILNCVVCCILCAKLFGI